MYVSACIWTNYFQFVIENNFFTVEHQFFSFFYAVEYETYRYSKDIHGSDDILKVGFFSSVWYNTCITLETLMLQG